MEIYLTEVIPGTQFFGGIIELDERGIWFTDSEKELNAPVQAQYLIPWAFIKTLQVHHTSL